MRCDPFRSAMIAALFSAACSSASSGLGEAEAPHPTGMTPSVGDPTAPTAVQIDGTGFFVKAKRSTDGGAPTIDTRHRAWLGDAELSDVTWVSATRLTATVPAGLPVGKQSLTVENALGGRGSLDAAFTVVIDEPASLAATLDVPGSVPLGGDLPVSMTVRNTGGSTARQVTPAVPPATLTGTDHATATLSVAPAPASADIAGGESQTFTWTYRAGNARGVLTIAGSASGTDASSNATVSAVAQDAHVTLAQAALDPAVTTGPPGTIVPGEPFPIEITFWNNGTADVSSFALDAPVVVPRGVTVVQSAPAIVPTTIAAGSNLAITWTVTPPAAASSYTVTFSAHGTDGSSGQALQAQQPVDFVVYAAPRIASLTPANGPSGGGTSVAIAGTGFRSGATVTFGGIAATNVSVTSPDSITATTPAHDAGFVDVVVTNSDTQSATRMNGFTYVSQPTISSVSPNSGTAGTPVTISGTDFQTGATVTFGGIAATDVSVISSNSITATTPVHDPGPVDITVSNPDSGTATSTGGFTYN